MLFMGGCALLSILVFFSGNSDYSLNFFTAFLFAPLIAGLFIFLIGLGLHKSGENDLKKLRSHKENEDADLLEPKAGRYSVNIHSSEGEPQNKKGMD